VLSVAEIMAILPATVPRLRTLTDGLSPDQLRAPPEPDSWSVNDVLAHLRACNDVLGGAARRIIAEDHPSWRAMSPRTWQRKSGYHAWDFRDAFAAFAEGREALLEVLAPLSDEAWQRTASVTVPPGKVYERSVQYYGDWLAEHERGHVAGLPAIIARAG
jgi:hypothetical protein